MRLPSSLVRLRRASTRWSACKRRRRCLTRDALRRLKLSIPVALDRDGKVAEKYGATAIPYTIVIGRNGNVSHVFVGSGPRLQEDLKGAIESHLSPPAQEEPASKE